MKTILSNSLLILLVRVFLGGLFIVSALDKLTDTGAFTASILNYKIIGPQAATIVATIIPSLELLCGACLILGLYPRSSTFILIVLLTGFTVVVLSALWRGLDIACGCFSQDPLAAKIGYSKVAENAGMILLGIYLLFVPKYGISILQILKKPE